MELIKKDLLIKYCYIHLPKIILGILFIIINLVTYYFSGSFIFTCLMGLFHYSFLLYNFFLIVFGVWKEYFLGILIILFFVSLFPLGSIMVMFILFTEKNFNGEWIWKNKIAD